MAEPQQYSTGLVNIVGINQLGGASRPISPGVQYNPGSGIVAQPLNRPQFQQIPDITDAKFEQMRADSAARYESVLEALNSRAKVRQAQLQAKNAPERLGELAQVFGVLSEGALQYVKIQKEDALKRQQAAQEWQQQEAKRLLSEQEARDKETGLHARAALEEVFINAQDTIRQYGLENGAAITRSDMERVLREFQDLPPDIQESLWSFAGTQMRQIESDLTSRTFSQAEEDQRTQTAMLEATIKAKLTHDFAALTNPMMSQEDTDLLIADSMKWVNEQTQQLDPTARMQIVTSVMNEVAANLQVGSRGRVKMEQTIADLNEAFNYIETNIRPQYGDDPLTFSYMLDALGVQYPNIQEILRNIPNNQEMFEGMVSNYETQRKYRQSRIEEEMSNRQIDGTGIAHASELAWGLMQGNLVSQSNLVTLQRKPAEQRTPEESLALSLYQQWTDAREQYNQLRQKLRDAEMQGQGLYLKFNAANNPRTTTYIDNSTQPPRAYELLVQDETGGAVYIQEGATQEQLQVAQEEIADVIYQINDLRQRTLQTGFNLDNPSDKSVVDSIVQDAMSYQQAVENGQPLNRRLRQEIGLPSTSPRSYSQRGSASGFSWAASEPPPGYQSGVAPIRNMARTEGVVIPFDARYEGQISVSSDYGSRIHPVHGDVRNHYGVDLSGDAVYNTDVGAVSPTGGYVISAEEWDGYGGTVMVLTPEGYVEQFSHLRSFHVQPGQQIPPGEFVGVIGGDASDPMPGTSTGRHLHYQVWKPGTEDFTNPEIDTVDPMAYLSTVHTYENVPLGVGQVQTPNAPTYTHSPDAMGIGGGNWVAGAMGGGYPTLQSFLSNVQIPSELMYGRPRTSTQPAQSGDYKNKAIELLRDFEGFSETAYWDVNHWRVGYGSDTLGGTGREVQQGDTTTREEAERDLLARLQGFEQTVVSQVGNTWNALPDNTKAALLSVAYNYGSLPNSVVAAVGTGNVGQIASAIEALQGDDDGINAGRRQREAEYARQSSTVSAPNPIPQALSPNTKSSYPYPNNRNNNYGYETLLRTPSLAYAIANASNEVGIPGQWLADILAFTTNGTFTPRQVSQYANAAEVVTNVTLPLMREYKGRINTLEDLYELLSTGSITGDARQFRDEILQLGNAVGRRYRTQFDTLASSLGRTHEYYHAGCPTCEMMMNRYRTIIPHEGSW